MAIQAQIYNSDYNLPLNLTHHNNNNALASHFNKQQSMEIDYLINSQNELLKQTIRQQTNHQLTAILTRYEANATVLLKQKDEEIAKANTRTMELEEFLRKIEMENQGWQRIAMHNESVLVSLTNTISQMNENADLRNNNTIQDEESCCDERFGENMLMICRRCNSRSSSVVFLPCRHLCSCVPCEQFIGSCPVCKMVKKSIIHALI
ncbi:E3 ubiquitin-protein ligase BOI [Impatiens glandulifera]|uniref:E3 ubiquitin-protein ligase BOI n=1 Tax=Impatiens glandulifera TaxID=253017 RepID=UPI001FB16CD6|nr:E3 ubiquitin-protein ligase BOI [Impatiens glandulifera]